MLKLKTIIDDMGNEVELITCDEGENIWLLTYTVFGDQDTEGAPEDFLTDYWKCDDKEVSVRFLEEEHGEVDFNEDGFYIYKDSDIHSGDSDTIHVCTLPEDKEFTPYDLVDSCPEWACRYKDCPVCVVIIEKDRKLCEECESDKDE
jgi:hypothetical protein